MKKLAIGLMTFLLCFSNTVNSKEWSDREKQIYYFYAGSVIADGLQSATAMRKGGYREANPIYGNHISDEEILLGTIISLWGFHRMIEHDAPEWLLTTTAVMRWGVVLHNHEVGVRINIRL